MNKYYKTRKRARESRYFLFQDKNNKWNNENKLLAICSHRPRQKKYQMCIDLSAIFGISFQELKVIIENSQNTTKKYNKNSKVDDSKIIETWIMHLTNKKIKNISQKSATAQKDYKGGLGQKINDVVKKRKNLSLEEQKLYNMICECKKLAFEISKELWPDKEEHIQRSRAEKFNSIFSFAQIYNIVFKDRSGFSNTCPICSMDNSLRIKTTNQDTALASKLSGLKVRIIDGVVMRICDSISNNISSTLWNSIQSALSEGKKIKIPLILEQNHFEFEPSLQQIKRKKGNQSNIDENFQNENFNEKEKRIKNSADRICPYNGVSIGESGEIDHIIPKASKYGELNDEANLIYASRTANQGKKENQYSLEGLHENYKKRIFKQYIDKKYNDYKEIKNFIYKQLETDPNNIEEGVNFKFGRYMNFSNLVDENKIAFRHALFLKKDDPLRKKVINSMQNRNKTIVNGTQRYLAQCIADKIWRTAKKKNQEKLIEFDYFEYPSNAYYTPKEKSKNNDYNSDAHHLKSVYWLRKYYEKYDQKLKKIKKEKGHEQKFGSHVIDAQMVFLLALEDHKSEGAMNVTFFDIETITQGFKNPKNPSNDNFLPLKAYTATTPNHIEYLELNRKQSKKGYRVHRSFHRADFYANHFVPLIVYKEDNEIKIKAGFSHTNSIPLTKKDINSAFKCLIFSKNEKIQKWAKEKLSSNIQKKSPSLEKFYEFLKSLFPKESLFYINWHKQKIHEYFIKNFSSVEMAKAKNLKWNKEVQFLSLISYKTKKENITLNTNNKENKNKDKDIQSIIENVKNFQITINKQTLNLPIKKEWEKLLDEWKNYKSKQPRIEEDDLKERFEKFLKDYFLKENKFKHHHQKTRKVFSLPVKSSEFHYLQKRQSWDRIPIYQICADSESREDNNKFSRFVFCKETESLKQIVNEPFISKDIFKLKQEKDIIQNNYLNIDPNKWLKISKELAETIGVTFPKGIKQIEYKIENKTSPKIKLIFNSNFDKSCVDDILNSFANSNDKKSIIKPNSDNIDKFKQQLEEILENKKESFIYKGGGFNASTKRLLEEYFRRQLKLEKRK